MSQNIYTENDLNVNLNELAHETIRELFLAAKKVSVYSGKHPLSFKAIGRAFFQMEKVFRYKHYLNFNIHTGHLYALNIKIRPSVFADQILEYMQQLDLDNILFERSMTKHNLELFLDRLVKRMPNNEYKNVMASYLVEKKIESITVNSEFGENLFKNSARFQGDLVGDFTVRHIVGGLIGDDFSCLAKMLTAENWPPARYHEEFNLDYFPELVNYLIPEKIASVKYEHFINYIYDKITLALESSADNKIDSTQSDDIKNLILALNYHSQREEIIDSIGNLMIQKGLDKNFYSAVLPQTAAIKVETSEKIDDFLYATFNEALPGYNLEYFNDIYGRIIRTGQHGKARAVINILMHHLAGPDLDIRQKALECFRMALSINVGETGNFQIKYIAEKVDEYLTHKAETFEFSDLLWETARATLSLGKYDLLAEICTILLKYREQVNGIWNYDSFAVKKTVEELNRQEIIEKLINNMMIGTQAVIHNIRDILVTIGSEETARALSGIISHESRQIRQNVLKILGEMGKSSLKVFVDIMRNDQLFEREDGRRELSDDKWYIIRNAIFVLGSLKDADGCLALRLHLNDSDTRVRREIVFALEKIGGEAAADLLLVMADDSDDEIREAAIIAIGIIGNSDNSPELIDLARKHPTNLKTIITSLGKLGGKYSREFLLDLLSDRDRQSDLATARFSREDMKLAIVKALGRIGDIQSIEKLRELSQSSKKIFGNSKVGKAAEQILSQKK
ncbi:MAG: HEAT repeat domain-containing protein [Candidatus Zixiibacteriota bacterium]